MRETTLGTIQSVVGKILYIAPLIPGSKYHLSELHGLNDYTGERNKNDIVIVTEEAKEKLQWWLVMTRLSGQGMPIPTGYDVCPPWAVIGDSDAAGTIPYHTIHICYRISLSAGGTRFEFGHGMGAVMNRGWAYVAWPRLINSEEVAPCCNAKWRHKVGLSNLVKLLDSKALVGHCKAE